MRLTDCDLHGKAAAQYGLIETFKDVEVERGSASTIHFDVIEAAEKHFLLCPHDTIERILPPSGMSCAYRSVCSEHRGQSRLIGAFVVMSGERALAIFLEPGGKSEKTLDALGWVP